MINKGEVIKASLLALGEVQNYNNNDYAIYLVAEQLFSQVENEISTSPYFVRNLTYRKLNVSTKSPDLENRNVYVIEPDVINIIRIVNNADFEIIGENIHTYESSAVALLNVKLRLEEQNALYFNLYKWLLCTKLCEAYAQFEKKLQYVNSMYAIEVDKIVRMFPPTSYDYSEENIEQSAIYRG